MNKETFDYLKSSLLYLGFGDDPLLLNQLEEALCRGSKDFQLYTEAHFDEYTKLETELYFHRSDQLNRYQFTKYYCLLRNTKDSGKDRSQTIYVNNGEGITLKESFNLLQGRSVYKEFKSLPGDSYHAWIQLNFKEKDLLNDYKIRQLRAPSGYDLEKTLAMYPIQELHDDQMKAELIRSLKKGNIHLVTFDKVRKTEKMFIEANPMYSMINIYPLRDLRK